VADVGFSRVHRGRAIGHGFHGVSDRRQFFVVDLDRRRRRQRLLLRVGRNDGHGSAQHRQVVGAEKRLVVIKSHIVAALDVRCGHYPGDARHLFSRAAVDAPKRCPVVRAAHHRNFQSAVRHDIRAERSQTAGFEYGPGPDVGHADLPGVFIRHHIGGAGFTAQETGGQFHRLEYPGVSGTSAQVVAQGMSNFIPARIRIFVQQRLGGHNHAGRAVAALDGPGQHKGFLNQMGVFGGAQPFDRQYLGIVDLDNTCQTGAHGFAVYDNSTGPALPFAVT